MARNSRKTEITSSKRVRRFSLAVVSLCSIFAIACTGMLLDLRQELLDCQIRSRRARITAEELSNTLQIAIDAETAVRGFVLRSRLNSNKPQTNFLEPYDRAVKRLPQNLDKVRTLIVGDVIQQNRYRQLNRLIHERMQLLKVLAETHQQFNNKQLASYLDAGKQKMDRLREVQFVMRHAEQTKLSNGIKELTLLQARQAFVVNLLGGCVGIIFAIAVREIWLQFRREEGRLAQAQLEVEAAHCELQVMENAATARATTAAKIAHDLKHWLQPIQSSVEMMERYRDRYPDKIPNWLERIKVGVAAIDRLAKDTVLVFQGDAGQLKADCEPTNLVQMLSVAIDDVQTSKHRISFSLTGTPSVVLIDRVLIDRAIRNLLNNAIKYSPNGGQIHVQLEFGSRISILVADQGIGIPKEKRESLFQEFHRAENVGGIPGTGLGLAVVRAAAIVHGGDVSVESGNGLRIDGVDEEFRTVFRLELSR